MQYDPAQPPDPSEWVGASELERIDAVLCYHRQAGARAGNLRLHAAIHVTVETQLAEAYAPTVRTMTRLIEEGLDRHDAIHAIGAAVADQIFEALQGRGFDGTEYETRLDALTAESWLSSGGR